MSQSNYTPSQEDDYIIVLGFIKDFLRRRKLIIVLVLVFLLIGIIKVIFTPEVYSSKVTFLSQSASGSSSKSLGGIAQILGAGSVNNNDSSDLPTFLYPQIIESLPYLRNLYDTPIALKNIDSTVTYKEYVLSHEPLTLKQNLIKYTIELPSTLFGIENNDAAIAQSRIDTLEYENQIEKRVINSLRKKIFLNIDEENGTLEVEAQLINEPEAAAQLAMSATQILQEELIRYRIARAKEKYDFIQKRFEERKEEYNASQVRLAAYNDRNPFNSTQSSQIKKTRLQNESSLLFAICSDLEQQLMNQSIKVKEDTPTFTVINPAVVPLSPVNNNKLLSIIIFGFIGFIIAVVSYFFLISARYVKSLYAEIS